MVSNYFGEKTVGDSILHWKNVLVFPKNKK